MNATPTDPTLLREDRLASLRQTELLDQPAEAFFDRITRMVARHLKCDTALLSLVEADRQFFSSQCGLPEPYASERQTPLSHSFCKYVVSSDKPFMVRDARAHPLVADNGAVRDLGVIAYLGVPVHDARGRVLGSLCAIGSVARDWSEADVALLQDLAGVIEDEIALRRQSRLAIALAEQNAILAREYHHRVKNALAVSAALVKLSARDAKDIAGVVETTSARLAALASAHDALITRSDDVDLETLARRLLAPYGGADLLASIGGPGISLRHEEVTPICLFLHELATNSAKYGAFSQRGGVSLRWTLAGDNAELVWQEETDFAHSGPEGFGGRLLEASARQLQGRCELSRDAAGLTVTLRFPREAAPGN